MKSICPLAGVVGNLCRVASIFLLLAALPGIVHSDNNRRDLEHLDPPFRESVLRGWNYFHNSYAEDGVACVHCHTEHSDIVPWAGAYPKVQIFDGTTYEVKTLHMVVTEALERHTDLSPMMAGRMVDDLISYIYWWGDGEPLTPGISEKTRPPEEDLEQLTSAANRGRNLFQQGEPNSCSHCHTIGKGKDLSRITLNDVFLGFPKPGPGGKQMMSLHTYLSVHIKQQGVTMNAEVIPDIAAYLADLSRGQILRPGKTAVKTRVQP